MPAGTNSKGWVAGNTRENTDLNLIVFKDKRCGDLVLGQGLQNRTQDAALLELRLKELKILDTI